MSWPVFTAELLAAAAVPAGSEETFVVPAGKVAIITWWSVYNAGSVTGSFDLYSPGHGGIIDIARDVAPDRNQPPRELRYVRVAGAPINLYCNAGTMYGWVTGFLLNAS